MLVRSCSTVSNLKILHLNKVYSCDTSKTFAFLKPNSSTCDRPTPHINHEVILLKADFAGTSAAGCCNAGVMATSPVGYSEPTGGDPCGICKAARGWG